MMGRDWVMDDLCYTLMHLIFLIKWEGRGKGGTRKAVGNQDYSIIRPIKGFEDLARDDEHLSDMGEHIKHIKGCKTYTIDQIIDKEKHNFSLFHTNIRSLNNHHTQLDSLLSTTNLRGCSETWLN